MGIFGDIKTVSVPDEIFIVLVNGFLIAGFRKLKLLEN